MLPGVNSDVMVSLGSMLGIIFDGIWHHWRVDLGGMLCVMEVLVMEF